MKTFTRSFGYCCAVQYQYCTACTSIKESCQQNNYPAALQKTDLGDQPILQNMKFFIFFLLIEVIVVILDPDLSDLT
jgi:hypothetical protein